MATWEPRAVRDLLHAIADKASFTDPNADHMFGKLKKGSWGAVEQEMAAKGYTISLDVMQAKWSRLARGELAAARSRTRIPNNTSVPNMIRTLVAVAFPLAAAAGASASSSAAAPAATPAAAPAPAPAHTPTPKAALRKKLQKIKRAHKKMGDQIDDFSALVEELGDDEDDEDEEDN